MFNDETALAPRPAGNPLRHAQRTISEPARLTRIDNGYRYLIPADVVPPHAALDPFVGRLDIQLQRHREAASEAGRLRVAVHSGVLYAEAEGTCAGVPLVECVWLLDTDAGRELLDDNPAADPGLLLTDHFYRDVVGSGTTLDACSGSAGQHLARAAETHRQPLNPRGPL